VRGSGFHRQGILSSWRRCSAREKAAKRGVTLDGVDDATDASQSSASVGFRSSFSAFRQRLQQFLSSLKEEFSAVPRRAHRENGSRGHLDFWWQSAVAMDQANLSVRPAGFQRDDEQKP